MTKIRAAACGDWYKFVFGALICFSMGGFASAQNAGPDHTGHVHQENAPPRVSGRQEKLNIPDVDVVTQDGKPVKFYTDLVKGKKVFISFIFTSCRLTCPLVGRNLQKLQDQLGSGLGKDASLVTVSTDPTVDTPPVIKKWGDQFNRREGWTIVTGDEVKIKQLLRSMTGGTRQIEGEHTSILILYDGTNGAWDTTSSRVEPVVLVTNLGKLGKKPAN